MRRSGLLALALCLAWPHAAPAADLPSGAARPSFLRVCSWAGKGFFVVPGSDTCLAVGAKIEFDGYVQQPVNYQADALTPTIIPHLAMDAMTQTEYGTMRSFLRVEVTQAGTQRARTDIEYAFISLAGAKVGRTDSTFNFYAGALNTITLRGPDITANLLKYGVSHDSGLSWFVSLEGDGVLLRPGRLDPSFRNQLEPDLLAGRPAASRLPDLVGTIQYAGDWGKAQISGAVGQLRLQNPDTSLPRLAALAGLQLNMPKPLDSDQLWVQVAAASGGNTYLGFGQTVQDGKLSVATPDGVIGPGGNAQATAGVAVTLAYSHSISDRWTGNLFGSFANLAVPHPQDLRPLVHGVTEWRLGGNVVFQPVRNLNITTEFVWVNASAHTPVPALGPEVPSIGSASSLVGLLQVTREF